MSITVALAGNPNTGKTSFFNSLTGLKQSVGNWPGVTVEKKEGKVIYKGVDIKVVDLPGTYSLSTFSLDELIARHYILEEKPDVVLNVVDATNLRRNLYLTLELLETETKVVVALNMFDEAQKRKIKVDINCLAEALLVPIVPTVAAKKKGISDVLEQILFSLDEQKATKRWQLDYGKEIEEAISYLSTFLDEKYTFSYPKRYVAIKLLEDDEHLLKEIRQVDGGLKIIEIAKDLRDELSQKEGEDLSFVFVNKRYRYIDELLSLCSSDGEAASADLTDRIDNLVTNRFFSIPIFLAVMALVFMLTFRLGEPLAALLEEGIGILTAAGVSLLTALGFSPFLVSLFLDGIVGGLGIILGVVPFLALMYLFLGFLEESGYIARVAYVMDRPMARLGISGKAVIPLILGFGCNVPAVMATRILPNEKERLVSILVNPLISCSARLPVFILLAQVFFPAHVALVVMALYALSILMALFSVLFLGKLFKLEEGDDLLLELPSYHFPSLLSVIVQMWDKVKSFLKRAFTVILPAAIIIWFLASLPLGVEYAGDASLIGILSSKIAFIFAPLGFGAWQAVVALVFGVLAKEMVISALGVVYAGAGSLAQTIGLYFTPLSAVSFMVFILLYAPCVATMSAINSETGSFKWVAVSIIYSFILAWLTSFLVYRVGSLFGF